MFLDENLCLMVILVQMWYDVSGRYLYMKYKPLVMHIWISKAHLNEIYVKILSLYNL